MSRPISEAQLRSDIVEVCRRLYARRLIAGLDGNVSARLRDARIVITPSGRNKGYLKPEELIVMRLDGKVLRPGGRDRALGPSSETALHLEAYRLRPGVQAVVHAHPPSAIARTLMRRPVAPPAIPEAVTYLGPVPTAPYATPGTSALAASIVPSLADPDVRALMLERHGSLTLGSDVYDAFNLLDALEHTARLMTEAERLGPVTTLPPDEVARLANGTYRC